MKIYAKSGVMDIVLRPLSAGNPEGDAIFCDSEVGMAVDIAFTAYDGKKHHIVQCLPDDSPDIMILGKWFRYTSDPDVLAKQYRKE